METEIQGRFTARLREPITLETEVRPADFISLHLTSAASRVVIRPAETPETDYDPEFPEPPGISVLTVLVTRRSQLDNAGQSTIPRDEKQRFEDILIEAITRLLQLVKLRASQWHIDTRHPVAFYTSAYFHQATLLESDDHWRLPAYTRGSITFRDLIEPMTPAMWNQLADTIDSLPPPLAYFEFICEAKVLRSRVRYNDSILYAGVACELVLEQLHASILSAGKLAAEPRKRPKTSGAGWLKCEIHRLAPLIDLNWDALQVLLDGRNAVAHGDPVTFSYQDADSSIDTATAMAKLLEARLAH